MNPYIIAGRGDATFHSATWVQVYSIYMLVLSSHHPCSTSELATYQLLIVQHSKMFECPSWLQYDIEFHQWAAANRFTKWLQIHPQFYVYPFTAHGKATAWCPVCHLDGGNHSYDCPRLTFIQPYLQSSSLPYSGPFYPPSNSSSSIPRSLSTNTPHIPPAKHSKPDHCIRFNKNKGSCPHGADCRFIHKCACCQGGRSTSSHPAPTSLLETSLHMNYSFAACITTCSFIKIQLPHYHLSS